MVYHGTVFFFNAYKEWNEYKTVLLDHSMKKLLSISLGKLTSLKAMG